MTLLESRLPDFPANPEDGFEIKEPLPDGGHVIWKYSEPFNQWTYEIYGNALQGYIYTDQVRTRIDETVRSDEPELLTQRDVNLYLDAKESGGGGNVPGKESKPWIQINSWGMRRSPYGGSPIYECSWSCNSNAIYTWQYEIDVDGDNNWIDIAEHPQKDDLGFSPGGEFPNQLTLANTSQEERYPNALMRYRITAELNSIKSELSSGAIAAWEVRHDDYEPPLYEDGTAVDLEPYATTDYVDEKVEQGELAQSQLDERVSELEKRDPESYLDKSTANEVTTGFRIKCNNQTFFSASGGELGLYHLKEPTDVTHAATKGYVDNAVSSSGGGVVFTEQYNGNRFFKPGLDTTGLNEGEVMFCSNGASTNMFNAITHVCLPEAGIDWTKFTRIGTIEVRNGGTVCGHLQVVSAVNNPGRNWKVQVKVLDVQSNELEPESGHPCYFWGMFTG